MTVAISARGVTKTFRGRPVLKNVDWSVKTGHIHGLIGANGAGKTTLLRLALGVLSADQGSLTVAGERVGQDSAEMRQRVHYVASGHPMAGGFRTGEWVRYASLLYDRWDSERISRLLKALELDPAAAIGQLSTGQQISLKLAIAIAARPDVMLLDEPTNGLDVVVKRQILQLIIDMAASEGTTIVMATHNIQDVERMADSISVLYEGRMVLTEDIDAMKQSVNCLQVVLSGGWPLTLDQDPRIIQVKRRGQVALVTVQGDVSAVQSLFIGAGATLVEPIPLDLTDVFAAILKKEGYSRDTLEWESI